MKTCSFKILLVGMFLATLATVATADEDTAKEPAESDQQRIAGTWQVVELVINGNPAKEADAKQITVANNADGSWSIQSKGEVISKGVSKLDSTQQPKAIDFTITEGGGTGNEHRGIYELGDQTRRLCFALTGAERPKEFSSEPGSGHVLVRFERVPANQ